MAGELGAGILSTFAQLGFKNNDIWIFKMRNNLTGVILAGGENKRFAGMNKAFIRIGEKRIIDRIYRIYNDLFKEIILVTNDPLQYLEWDLQIVADLFPMKGSLTGIHAGLFYMTTPYAFFAACDTPFLNKVLVGTIIDALDPRFDIIIPETDKGFEPLCAVYSKACLKPIEQQLFEQELKIQKFFRKVRVKKLSEKSLRGSDPNLLSFFNVNTPDDLKKAENIESQNQMLDARKSQRI
jgi:molybdopterin-guanine dinucleotide biosynthesis protein A